MERFQKKEYIIIILLYLFQISAIVGISLGYFNWFIEKTPLVLGLNFLTLIYFTEHLNIKFLSVGFLLFLGGMIIEWCGISFSFIFGEYFYGENLGYKLFGVPLLIGVNWMVLVVISNCISKRLVSNKIIVSLLGAFLMVFLDFFIEPNTERFDFWIWTEGEAPFRNFVMWFVFAFLLQLLFSFSTKNKFSKSTVHIYLSQLLFFVYFYFYYGL